MTGTASTTTPAAHPGAVVSQSEAQPPPRPEHPDPLFEREPWLSLNGRWRFTFDPQDAGEQSRWYRLRHPQAARVAATGGPLNLGTSMMITQGIVDPFAGEIVVPFPWESRLSGVGDTQYKGVAWYQRSIEVPAEWAEPTEVRESAAPAETAPGAGLASAGEAAQSSTAPGAAVRWRLRPYLCFGAVDWNAKVWVDGRFVAEHDGGYTPFALDLSRHVRPGRAATLTVRVLDTCAADTLIGKQTDRWYTHSGGIWQPVWLEGRPAAHLTRVHVTPHLAAGTATFALRIAVAEGAAGTYRVAVESKDGAFPAAARTLDLVAGETDATLAVTVPSPRAWSPEDPHLYECVVSLVSLGAAADPHPAARSAGTRLPGGEGIPPLPLGEAAGDPRAGAAGEGVPAAGAADAVSTYFGLRDVSTGRWEDKPYEYMLLNGEPVYLRGALDQAFHPDGIHAYPTDDAIRADVQAAKDLGLNLLRCHIKVNDPRYYYWCDRLGVLVMYDFPSASIYTPKARANWEATFRAALERDYSHPSVFAWILFNETWGLEEHQTPASWHWVRERYEECKRLDPTRIVEDNSACLYDHVVSDINTWHFYIGDYGRAKRHVERVVAQTYEGSPFNYVGHLYSHEEGASSFRQASKPLLNSEYAGIGARQGDKDVSYSFKFLTTELRRHDKVCGYVYTELTDVEWEHNGLLEYDRTPKEFGYDAFVDGMSVADLNAADVVGLDCPPCRTLPPGSTFAAQAFVSHWDRRPIRDPRLSWRVSAVDRFGERREVAAGETRPALRRYGVVDAGPIETRLPDEPCLATVALTLVDAAGGTVRARNYVNLDVRPRADVPAAGGDLDGLAPETVETETGYAVRFAPEAFADTSWPQPVVGRGHAKFAGAGAGWVEYVLPLPEAVRAAPERVRRLRLRFEAAARNARSRLAWPDYRHVLSTDYPQTEARKRPTDLAVSISGVPLGTVRLPDDPADARGVLSLHLHEDWDYASYGYLTTLEAGAAAAPHILGATRNGQVVVRFEVPRTGTRGGLTLYGERMGATPVAPTLFLDLGT